MEDEKIIALFWNKSEEAISQTEKKYGAYCSTIARNILQNEADVEECVNDTYLKVWNSIPPHQPKKLVAFLGKITREICIDKYRMKYADKRGCGQLELALNELDGCVPTAWDVEQNVEIAAIGRALNDFLKKQPSFSRKIFVCRYWYFDSIKDIAKQFCISESKVKSNLFRTRNKLRSFLEGEGIFL